MGEPIKRDPQSAAIGVVRSSGFSETGFGIGLVRVSDGKPRLEPA